MRKKPEKDLTLVGDFLRYTGLIFLPFCLLGIAFNVINGFSLMALIVNPLIYSIGISLILIVIFNDVNSVLSVVGLGKEPQLAMHLTYSKEVQEISTLLATMDFPLAMKKVEILLRNAPTFAMAHTLKGEGLLHGFRKLAEARACFDKALELAGPDEEAHRIAKSLKEATYTDTAQDES